MPALPALHSNPVRKFALQLRDAQRVLRSRFQVLCREVIAETLRDSVIPRDAVQARLCRLDSSEGMLMLHATWYGMTSRGR